ncbi:hypothetical protein F470_02703, partial [Pseudomonas sp. URIL14HWK12:I10]
VTLWTLESAGALKARLTQLAERARNGAMPNVRAIGLGLGGLQQDLANSVQAFKINASAAQLLARNALWDLQDAVGGYRPGTAPMLLSLGGLWFQQDSLMRNHKALLEVASDERAEALAAVGSATLGVIGMGVEAAGFVVKGGTTIFRESSLSIGKALVKTGGSVAALAGVLEGVQYHITAIRLRLAGDHKAARRYRVASFSAIGSAVLLFYAAFLGGFLLGALGFGLFIALFTYGLTSQARSNESTPVEIWVRKCLWGLPESSRYWLTAEQLTHALNELNVAYVGAAAYTLKQSAFISKETSPGAQLPVLVGGPEFTQRDILGYMIKLPNYDKSISAYSFEIYDASLPEKLEAMIAKSGSGEDFFLSDISGVAEQDQGKYKIKSQEVFENNGLLVRGEILLREFHSLTHLEIRVKYWIDATNGSPPLIVLSTSEFHVFPTA